MNNYFKTIKFIKSATRKEEFLYDKKIITFLGRSNVGKSTLINSLINEKSFMKISKTPGRTIFVNYALVNDKFYFADVPGYGYAKNNLDSFPKLMNDFLDKNNSLVKIYLLIDSRRGISDEEYEYINYLKANYKLSIIFTKCDKLNSSEKSFLEKEKKEVEKLNLSFFEASNNNYALIEKIRKDIINSLN